MWTDLYNMELSYHWMETEEWIDAGCPSPPHPKEGGEIIKCAYCDWYGVNTSERYFVLEHVRPVHAFPDLSLDPNNIVVACNHCNEWKGGTIKNGRTIGQIVMQFREDLKRGIAKERMFK